MEIHLKIIGPLLLLLSFIHILFPAYFRWEEELQGLSLINRQMMYVHTFFVALVVLLMGLLCILFSEELITTRLGRILALGLFIFWVIRLVIQFFGYSSKLWKGKTRETIIHLSFSVLWTYLSVVFFIIWLQPGSTH